MEWYGFGRNAFSPMDSILDPNVKKLASVIRTGMSSKGKPWAQGILCLEGKQYDTWINELGAESPVSLKAGETYDAFIVTQVVPKKDGDIKYRSYVQPNPPAESQGLASEPRYRPKKSTISFMKKYAELVGLETEGHWVHKATDHLVVTLEEMEIFSLFAHYFSEK